MPDAGWYVPDDEPGVERWWDGEQWTDQRREPQTAAADMPPPAAPSGGKTDRPWYKKKRFLIPLGLLALFIIAGIGASGDMDTDPVASDDPTAAADEEPADEQDAEEEPAEEEPAEEEPAEEEPETTAVGEPARDGKFEFTVSNFECGAESVGDDFWEEEAQGQYCLLEVTVENIGDEAQYLFADNQYLYDSEERRFSADSEATFALQPDGDGFFTEINPGNTIEGTIVFDVPEGAVIERAELHDSAFSGGVEVNLS